MLHTTSILNGTNIGTGAIADQFVPGIGSLHDTIVTAVGNLAGTGFDITKVLEVLTGQTHAIVDHGAGSVRHRRPHVAIWNRSSPRCPSAQAAPVG